MLYKFSDNHYINTDQVVNVVIIKTKKVNELRFTFINGNSTCFPCDSEEIAKERLNDYVHSCSGYD